MTEKAPSSVSGSKLRLCGALLIAAAFSPVTSKDGWRRIWRAFSLWFGMFHVENRASDALYEARLRACRGCPLWFRPLETCSSPLKSMTKELGCWCHMPTKARILSARCWLDEECGVHAPYGWEKSRTKDA